MQETNIYVLKLQEDKWYVGKTNDVDKRFQDHRDGQGSAWTNKYPPVELVEVQKGNSFDEDKITKVYMLKYVVENVRGDRAGLTPKTFITWTSRSYVEI
jgi:predicted GIY-YIG superfamily endonuclease